MLHRHQTIPILRDVWKELFPHTLEETTPADIIRYAEKHMLVWVREPNVIVVWGRYMGTARCLPQDDFDVETGFEIALVRALRSWKKADMTMRPVNWQRFPTMVETVAMQAARLSQCYAPVYASSPPKAAPASEAPAKDTQRAEDTYRSWKRQSEAPAQEPPVYVTDGFLVWSK